ncbi:MAG: type II 3-dehydroquinate dehydratase [Deltaproteobacteria bacterium CG11_big_fil_rev_8_21_14_0_20_47_16]|nr:MAG: type II 3-dehydroquinate dehydratase [Deltaproteobacteria bacterium CG11_big_fil_rev_8_21_14_0_20_47_16]
MPPARKPKKTSHTKQPLIVVLNGPNLHLLGKRETHIYGDADWAQIEKKLQALSKTLGIRIEIHHDDHEGHLIERLHRYAQKADAIVLNPGGLSHVSVALRDAVAASPIPVIEVHVSNLARREQFRSHSYISAVSSGIIMGFGILGYEMALWAAHKKVGERRNARGSK